MNTFDKPKIIIPKQEDLNITANIDYKNKLKLNFDPVIQKEKDELEELKIIRDGTGFSISKLLELKKRGYKILKVE